MIFNLHKIIDETYFSLKEESNGYFLTFWFFIFPIIISLTFLFLFLNINSNQLNNLVAFLSILIGSSINILVVMLSNKKNETNIRKKLFGRIYASISYFILGGIFLVVLVLILPWIEQIYFSLAIQIILFFIYFLFIHLLLILFTILKGFYSLYKNS